MEKEGIITFSASYPTLRSPILAQLDCCDLPVWKVSQLQKVALLEFCYTHYLSNGTCCKDCSHSTLFHILRQGDQRHIKDKCELLFRFIIQVYYRKFMEYRTEVDRKSGFISSWN